MLTWLAFSICCCTSAWIAIWSRRPTKARPLAVFALLIIVPASGGLLLTQRGWSAPIVPYLAELPGGEIQIDGVRMVPGVSITIMLYADGSSRLFELPWDEKTASQLQRMMEGGGEIRAKRSERKGNPDDEDYPMQFHPAPQPSHPEKQPEAVHQYERQG